MIALIALFFTAFSKRFSYMDQRGLFLFFVGMVLDAAVEVGLVILWILK